MTESNQKVPIPEVQKYWTSCSDGWLTMEPSEKGTWVKYSDFAAQAEELRQLRVENKIALKWLTNVATVDQVRACTREILASRSIPTPTPDKEDTDGRTT